MQNIINNFVYSNNSAKFFSLEEESRPKGVEGIASRLSQQRIDGSFSAR